MAREKSYVVRTIKLMMFLAGMIENEKYAKLKFFYASMLVVIYLTNLIFMSNGIFTLNDVTLRAEAVMITLNHSFNIIIIYLVHARKKFLVQIIEFIENDNQYHRSEELVSLTNDGLKRWWKLLIFFPIILAICGAITPIIFTLTYHNIGAAETLLYPTTPPWKITTPREYVMTWIFIGSVAFIPLLTYVCTFWMAVSLLIVVQSEFQILLRIISTMESGTRKEISLLEYEYSRNNPNFDLNSMPSNPKKNLVNQKLLLHMARLDTLYRTKMLEMLLQAIRYHQTINKARKATAAFVQTIASSALVYFWISMILTIANFTMQVGVDVLRQFRFGTAIIVLSSMFLLFCYIAERISSIHMIAKDGLYDITWHLQSVTFRKLMVKFMAQIDVPVHIVTFGMFQVNLEFFMKVLKTVYSALQLFLRFVTK